MVKKAFCVGINNYPGAGSDLKGCVNDANGWASVLADHYDFASSDVQVILDTSATKAAILDGLKALLAGAHAKDVLVFSYSGHGTYVPESGGDEPTYDEAMCPYDVSWNLLVDDELRELFAAVPKGVRLTVISDSCFSGTVTRVALPEILPGVFTGREANRRVRFLHPSLVPPPAGAVLKNSWPLAPGTGTAFANPWPVQPKRKMTYPQSSMTHLLVSGCTDKQYSYDATFGSTYAGAMSYSALQALKAAKYRLTYRDLLKAMHALLKTWGYADMQTPTLEGPSAWKRRIVFT